MHVRPAALGDIPTFVALGREMHKESPVYRKYDFDEPKVYDYFRQLIESDWGIVITLVKDDEIIGGIAAIQCPQWFGSDRWASDIALFIHPDHRGGRAALSLLRAYIAEAKAKGASQIVMATSTGFEPERIGQLFEAVGFQKIGAVYSMHVPKGEE